MPKLSLSIPDPVGLAPVHPLVSGVELSSPGKADVTLLWGGRSHMPDPLPRNKWNFFPCFDKALQVDGTGLLVPYGDVMA